MDTDGGAADAAPGGADSGAYALLLEHAACRVAPRALLATALEASAALAAPGGGVAPAAAAATGAFVAAAPGAAAGATAEATAALRTVASAVGGAGEAARVQAAEDG
jgi:hypothetical protein